MRNKGIDLLVVGPFPVAEHLMLYLLGCQLGYWGLEHPNAMAPSLPLPPGAPQGPLYLFLGGKAGGSSGNTAGPLYLIYPHVNSPHWTLHSTTGSLSVLTLTLTRVMCDVRLSVLLYCQGERHRESEEVNKAVMGQRGDRCVHASLYCVYGSSYA